MKVGYGIASHFKVAEVDSFIFLSISFRFFAALSTSSVPTYYMVIDTTWVEDVLSEGLISLAHPMRRNLRSEFTCRNDY